MVKELLDNIKKYTYVYLTIIVSIFSSNAALKVALKLDGFNLDHHHEDILGQINDFKKLYVEGILVTFSSISLGYIIAGCPSDIPWLKLIPTFLLAFPVYENRNAKLETWDRNSLGEIMDSLFFKTLYVVGISWLAADIFKGIV